jgi:hypothetical protein
MLVYVEIWYRDTADTAYRRHGIEELEGLLEVGAATTFAVDGCKRRVTVDRVAPTAVSIAALGTLWVTAQHEAAASDPTFREIGT